MEPRYMVETRQVRKCDQCGTVDVLNKQSKHCEWCGQNTARLVTQQRVVLDPRWEEVSG